MVSIEKVNSVVIKIMLKLQINLYIADIQQHTMYHIFNKPH